jgi:hypothetical protein
LLLLLLPAGVRPAAAALGLSGHAGLLLLLMLLLLLLLPLELLGRAAEAARRSCWLAMAAASLQQEAIQH